MAYVAGQAPTSRPPSAQGMRRNVLLRNRLNALSPERAAAFRSYVGAVSRNQAGGTGGTGTTRFVLPGSAEAEFGAQRANIGEEYTQGMAENNYARTNVDLANERMRRDQADEYGQARAAFPEQYIGRGLGRSGLMDRDLKRMTMLRTRQIGDREQDYARALGGLKMNRTQIERRRALALANLRMKHQAVLGDAAGRSIV